MSTGVQREERPGQAQATAAIWKALRQHWLLAGTSLGLGAAAGLALASRLPCFWAFSRLPRLAVMLAAAGLLSVLAGALLLQARRALAASRWWGAAGLAAAVVAGAALLGSGAARFSLPPQQYRLEVETLAGNRSIVHLAEVRGPDGRAFEPEEIEVESGWSRSELRGFVASGPEPAQLSVNLYDQPGKAIHLLFEEQPGGSQVLIRLDDEEQQVDLTGELKGMRLVELELPSRPGRWNAPVLAAGLVFWLAGFPLALFAAGAYGVEQAVRSRPVIAGWGARLWAFYPGLFVAVFLGLLLLPLAGYPGSLAKFGRNFFGSKQLLWAHSFVRARILQDVDYYETLRARDGWLVYSSKTSMDDFQNAAPFHPEELEQIRLKLDGLAERLDQAGIYFLVYVTPNKNTVYPDYVPPQIPIIGQRSRLDQVIDYQRQRGHVQILDLRPALIEARQVFDPQGRMVYLKTDTHWNAFGALTGYQQVMRALQERFPGLAPKTLDDFLVPPGSRVLGDMGNNWVPAAAPEEWVALEEPEPPRWRRYWLSEEMPVRLVTYHADAGLPEALFYHDSSMMWQYDYFAGHFRKAQFIWSYAVDLDFVLGEQPDVVVLQVTERFLPDLLKDGTPVDEPGRAE